MEDNYTKQKDELEVLSSVYGEDWKKASSRNYNIAIINGGREVILYITLPKDYPTYEPPQYELSAPNLSRECKREISNRLETIYLDSVGESVIYQWIECIRSYLQEMSDGENVIKEIEESKNVSLLPNQSTILSNDNLNVPEIIHGEIIEDRKSYFQGHVANVTSIEEVQLVLQRLQENKKIASATHNIHAYRVKRGMNKDVTCTLQDCDDDGENQAGSRLLHLLQIMDVFNVVVVVSRWFGGVHLGPDRFRHINNAARCTLNAAGFVTKKK